MCYVCYEERGSPKIVNDTTRRAADAISSVYDFNSVGGNAHIVFDDWNIDDESIDYCLGNGLRENIHEHTDAHLAIERRALTTFRALSLDERASALALQWGMIE